MTYRTKGTCSMAIQVELAPDHTIEHVEFIGGCSGNTQGVAILVQGMKAEDAIEKIEGKIGRASCREIVFDRV